MFRAFQDLGGCNSFSVSWHFLPQATETSLTVLDRNRKKTSRARPLRC